MLAKHRGYTSLLTHEDQDKMAATFQTTFSTGFLVNENAWIAIKI